MTEFSLVSGRTVLGRITNVRPDQPWLTADFAPTSDFEPVRPMFDRATELLKREAWDEWEALWIQVRESGIRLQADGQHDEIVEFALYVEGDRCRFRY